MVHCVKSLDQVEKVTKWVFIILHCFRYLLLCRTCLTKAYKKTDQLEFMLRLIGLQCKWIELSYQ